MARDVASLSLTTHPHLAPPTLSRAAHPFNGATQRAGRVFEDAHYMRRAITLARRAEGQTAPNPMVGAVIVSHGRIIGEGYHRRAGLPHAEVEALRTAKRRARGATLYVTLEPCNHTGRTPPCCDAIIAAGISQVIVGTKDPNPLTNGRGMARLRRAGIVVITGVLEEEANELIAPFRKVMRTGLPFVIAKIGQSLDGKIATTSGESRWITSVASRRLAHDWRRQVDAIVVGVNTVLRDDPLLTIRSGRTRRDRPMKIILDSRLRTPVAAKCLSAQSPAPTLIVSTRPPATKQALLKRRGAEVFVLPPRQGRVPLRSLCRVLARRGIHSILVEGGGEVFASALAERLVDRLVFFIAPVLIGGRTAPSAVGGAGIARLSQAIHLEGVIWRRLGPDLCVEARVVYPQKGARGMGHGAWEKKGNITQQFSAPRPSPLAPDLL